MPPESYTLFYEFYTPLEMCKFINMYRACNCD